MPFVTSSGFTDFSSFEDLGFSSSHRRDDVDVTTEITLSESEQVIPDGAVSDDQIDEMNVDKLRAGSLRVDEYLQSTGFVTGSAGWQIKGNGDVEFNSGVFRGSLVAGSIHIPDQDTTDDSFHVNASGNAWGGATESDYNTNPVNAKWRLDANGNAYFQNAEVTGVLKTTVFQKDVVSAVGGVLLITNADVLDADMTAADSATLTIKGDTTFSVNDMLHLKDGIDDEYMRVTDASAAPTYTVTRDLAGSYGANANPTWKEGTAVVEEGSSDGVSTYSGGFLKLLGSGTNSPRYGVFKRTGVAYNGTTEYVGIGNLNGLLDYTSDEYGFLAGTETDGYVAFDPVNGLRVKGDIQAVNIDYNPYLMFGLFGGAVFGGNKCVSMTRKGRYLLNPITNAWLVWDAFEEYVFNYDRGEEYTRTGLTITPDVNTRVMSGTTEYVIAFQSGGTACYRYDDDGQNEASVTVSGVVLTGVHRIGYSQDEGYVYLQDGADLASTSILRFTFSGTTLTYVDTITLDTAPNLTYGRPYIWIGDNNIVLVYISILTYFERYNKATGAQTTTRSWGSGVAGVSVLGLCTREDDNALIYMAESSTATNPLCIMQRLSMD